MRGMRSSAEPNDSRRPYQEVSFIAYDRCLRSVSPPSWTGIPGCRKKMFGGVGFLIGAIWPPRVNGKASSSGLDRMRRQPWLPNTRPFDMTGRPMNGWIIVTTGAGSDVDLRRWVEQEVRLRRRCRRSGRAIKD